jgi:hypothetical protein
MDSGAQLVVGGYGRLCPVKDRPPWTTAVVFVEKDWYDNTLRFLLGTTKSGSTNGAHLLQGELLDAQHHAGVWFKNVPSKHVKDGMTVRMDYMVPWKVILGVGLVPESEEEEITLGFKPNAITSLK